MMDLLPFKIERVLWRRDSLLIKENEVKDTTKDENKPVEQDVLLNKDVETNKVVNDTTTTTNIDKPEHEKEENA